MSSIAQLSLFAAIAETPVTKLPAQPRPKARGGWEIADHACRHCFGRVLHRKVKGHVVEVRCAECGVTEAGDHESICCCGAVVGVMGRVLECYRNPAVSKATPQEILIRERAAAKADADQGRTSRPVSVREF